MRRPLWSQNSVQHVPFKCPAPIIHATLRSFRCSSGSFCSGVSCPEAGQLNPGFIFESIFLTNLARSDRSVLFSRASFKRNECIEIVKLDQ